MRPMLEFSSFVVIHVDSCGPDEVSWGAGDGDYCLVCVKCQDARVLTAEVVADTSAEYGKEMGDMFRSYEGRDQWLKAIKRAVRQHNYTAYRHILGD